MLKPGDTVHVNLSVGSGASITATAVIIEDLEDAWRVKLTGEILDLDALEISKELIINDITPRPSTF